MRQARPLLLALALLATATGARASGVSLRWDHCYGDGGVRNKNFACDTNVGAGTLVGGFTLGADLAQVSGNEIVLDLASASEYLPASWDLYNVGSCRPTSLGMNVFNPTAVNCLDWGAGVEVGGIGAYNLFQRSDNTARIVAVIAVAPSFLQNLVAGQEYFSFNITINHQKSAGGTGVCLGCETPACIVFTSINITTPILANNRKITGPAYGGDSDFCSWQGGGITAGSGAACTAATPTAKRTWGAVKALYR